MEVQLLMMFIHIVITFFSGCSAYYIVYLDKYEGNLKLIELSDLTAEIPSMLNLNNAIDITPDFLRDRCGNPDVSPDGTKVVFGAITPNPESWDIYIGDLNIASGTIDNLQIIINTDFREEDPRFSYDGNSFVYKSGKSWITPILYDIVIYDILNQQSTTVVECPSDCNGLCSSECNHCELWGPAYHPCSDKISYTARICENNVNNDEIYVYDLKTQQKTRITDNTIPDMYSHWKRDGTLVFSRKVTDTDDLYIYDENAASISLYLSETSSDDDPYSFKQNNDLLLFIGLADGVGGYELYLVRNGIPYQMTSQTQMLGPVVFSLDIAVTIPEYCAGDNDVTTMNPTETEAFVTTASTSLTDNAYQNSWMLCLVHAFVYVYIN